MGPRVKAPDAGMQGAWGHSSPPSSGGEGGARGVRCELRSGTTRDRVKRGAMVAIDFGVTIRPTPQGGSVPEMMRANEQLLQAAAEHDLSCWVIDHFQFDAQPIFECLAFLAYQAGQHPGLRWGTLVLGQGYRNPALTAKIAATLQFLTGGRFILGLGVGDAEGEHHAYGYPFSAARVRVEQLDET